MPLQRLPNWIQFGAFLLALNAGMVNVLGLFTVLHQSVSHMTGNVSMLAMSLLDWRPEHFIYLSLVMSMTYWIVYFRSSSHPNLD